MGFFWAIFLTGIRIKPYDCMARMLEYQLSGANLVASSESGKGKHLFTKERWEDTNQFCQQKSTQHVVSTLRKNEDPLSQVYLIIPTLFPNMLSMFALRRNPTKDSRRIRGRRSMQVTKCSRQMWRVWVTLITSRFTQAQISLVCLISGHRLKVKVGHSYYPRKHNTIIRTIQ